MRRPQATGSATIGNTALVSLGCRPRRVRPYFINCTVVRIPILLPFQSGLILELLPFTINLRNKRQLFLLSLHLNSANSIIDSSLCNHLVSSTLLDQNLFMSMFGV
ncbi:MAG: hypothetical protein CMJ52_05415 [Planctomycetaceae bacterium]|nr:hypothetical protein [Planctomycetaceae bacterium]